MAKFYSRYAWLGFVIFFIPYVALAAASGAGLVPCGVVPGANYIVATECNLCDFGTLTQNVINFLLLVSIPLSVMLFAWAGVLYFSSAENPGQIAKAHKIFSSVLIGFVIVVSSWLVVQTLLTLLIDRSFWGNGGTWNTLACADPNHDPRNASFTTSSSSKDVRPRNSNIGDLLNSVINPGNSGGLSSVSPANSSQTMSNLVATCDGGSILSGTDCINPGTGEKTAPPTLQPPIGAGVGCGVSSCTATGSGRIVTYTNPDGTQETRQDGSIAWRNNNPGNMIAGAGGIAPVGYNGGFAVFATYEDGYNAMVANLQTPRYQTQTIAGAIATWAPLGDGNNNPTAYAQTVSQQTGLSSDTPMSSLSPSQMRLVANAIVKVEGYSIGKVSTPK